MVFKDQADKSEADKSEADKSETKEDREVDSTEDTVLKYKDLYQRVFADFQNYKRRIEKERLRWILQGQIEVLKRFLLVIDDLDRAIQSLESSDAGLEIIKKNTDKILSDLGVEEIDCSGMFDPDLHEALLQVESKNHKSGEIVEVFNKGYTINTNVIRHAKVSVAK